jgi:RNA polymerase sigma-70 factor (ECF subfamily)
MAQSEEAILIQQAQRGDLEAFNQLVLAHQDALYTVAYRLMGDSDTAFDMAQEALITAYRKLDTYQGGNFGAWLRRIVTNRCYDELRKHKRQPATSLDDGGRDGDGIPIPDRSPSPERIVQDNELQRAIQDCIASLSAEQRLVLVLSDVNGMAYQEIADQEGIQLGTVKSRLSRARMAMRQCLGQFEELLPPEFRLFNKPSA